MRASDAFPSTYLKAADILGKRLKCIIESVSFEAVSQDPDEAHKLVIHFKGASKAMVLNKGNTSLLTDLYGDETDLWTGQPVILTTHRTSFQGKPCNGLLLDAPPADAKVPNGKGKQAAPPPADEPPADFDDSTIPF